MMLDPTSSPGHNAPHGPRIPPPFGRSSMKHPWAEPTLFGRIIAFVIAVGGMAVLLGNPFSPVEAAEPAAKTLNLTLRYRTQFSADATRFEVRERVEHWDPKKTAIILCDMWDLHHCKRAVERVQELAPRMNEVVTKARDRGVLIIHAPSSCMAPYENTPMRQRAREAPTAKNLPKDIGS